MLTLPIEVESKSKRCAEALQAERANISEVVLRERIEDIRIYEHSSEFVDEALEKFMEHLFKLDRPITVARGALFGWAWSHPSVVLKQFRHVPWAAKALAG